MDYFHTTTNKLSFSLYYNCQNLKSDKKLKKSIYDKWKVFIYIILLKIKNGQNGYQEFSGRCSQIL